MDAVVVHDNGMNSQAGIPNSEAVSCKWPRNRETGDAFQPLHINYLLLKAIMVHNIKLYTVHTSDNKDNKGVKQLHSETTHQCSRHKEVCNHARRLRSLTHCLLQILPK